MISEVKGLVIRSVDLSDNDKLITIFTHDKGKILAVANGSRALKSRYMSAVQMFCYGNYTLYRKGDKFWVREVDLVESFFDLRNDLSDISLATYFCDVCDWAANEGAPDEELLRLTLNALYVIAHKTYPLPHIKAAFEFRAAAVLGFMPDVSACALCGRKEGDYILDVLNGNLICDECRNDESSSYFERNAEYDQADRRVVCLLTMSATNAIRYVLTCTPERVFAFSIPEDDARLFCAAAEKYLLNQIGRGFRSLDFYKQII